MKVVNADELIENLAEARFSWRGLNEDRADELSSVIDTVKENTEEIVNCSECKWWGVYDEPIKHCRRGMLKLPVRGYDFCSRGERKPDKK